MVSRSAKAMRWFAISVIVSLSACATQSGQELTPLQIQAFQKHQFEATKDVVFGSVVSVFQDLGYIIESADVETGFITAGSATSDKTGFWEAMGGQKSSGKTRATAFVEELRPDLVTVRLNFVDTETFSTAYGQESRNDTPIVDPKPYQVAFDKVEQAVFVRMAAQ